MQLEKVTFGLSCSWHAGEFFNRREGVAHVRTANLGNDTGNPVVKDIGKDSEIIEVEFDPGKVPFADILDYFWRIHDPDQTFGGNYASAVFTRGTQQYDTAMEARNAQRMLQGREIMTQILPVDSLYLPPDLELKEVPKDRKLSYRTSCT